LACGVCQEHNAQGGHTQNLAASRRPQARTGQAQRCRAGLTHGATGRSSERVQRASTALGGLCGSSCRSKQVFSPAAGPCMTVHSCSSPPGGCGCCAWASPDRCQAATALFKYDSTDISEGVWAGLDQQERRWLRHFLVHVNEFLPLLSEEVLRHTLVANSAAAPHHCCSSPECNDDGDWRRAHARTALVWACVATGALIGGDTALLDYSSR
jgi:hypothetical protein